MPQPIQDVVEDQTEVSFPQKDTIVLNPKSPEDLRAFLEYSGIDTNSYGVGKAKSVEALSEEIVKQDCIVSVDTKGNLHREVRVAAAHIYLIEGELATHRLVEKVQIYVPREIEPTTEEEALRFAFRDTNGEPRLRSRNLPTSLSELTRSDETFDAAIKRGIKEELQVLTLEDLWPLEGQEETKSSPSYPGLLSDYSKEFFRFHVHAGSDDYREVYIDIDPISDHENLVGVFVWEEIL